jgi:CDP-2,3-bis-(O-geranylgeranyl)-sn-glycerol synthase
MFRVAQLLYLMLPVYVANMAAPLARLMPRLARPISQRWLGSHKTWLGCALAVVAATAMAWGQSQLGWSESLVRYDDWFLLGPVCGLAAMLGDSTKSFVKRRLEIPPGKPWIPADQLDYAVAGLIALSVWYRPDWGDVLTVLALSFAGSIIINRLSYWLGIKSTPW